MNVKSVAVGSMGEMTNEVKILTDGTEFTNTSAAEAKGTAKWMENARRYPKAGDQARHHVRPEVTLSDNGKSIVQEVTLDAAGEVAQKAVLDKV